MHPTLFFFKVTMEELKLISPIPCSVNHYMKPRPFLMGGRAQVTMYETADAKQYKREFVTYVKEQAKLQGFHPSTNKFQHYYVECDFYFPRIDMDANNYWKLMFDAITESQCVWIDDTQACERVNKILYDAKNPRIELRIFPVDYIGIFPNQEHLEHFKAKCIQCTRYKEGKCSLLNKAIEGRIQQEITGVTCTKYKQRSK